MKNEKFEIKDIDKTQTFPSGMQRSPKHNKINYTLIPLPLIKRLATLYTNGGKVRGNYNWTKSDTTQEMMVFIESAKRHFEEWLSGARDEDHLSACIFNMYASDYIADFLIDGKRPSIMPFGIDKDVPAYEFDTNTDETLESTWKKMEES